MPIWNISNLSLVPDRLDSLTKLSLSVARLAAQLLCGNLGGDVPFIQPDG